MNRQKSYGNTHSCNFCAGACSYSSIVDVCPCYIYDICPLLLGNICEHCWIFKYVACRRPSEFHQSKRVVPRCGQILVFGLSHAASQPRSRSGQRTQSFHHLYCTIPDNCNFFLHEQILQKSMGSHNPSITHCSKSVFPLCHQH